MFEEVYKSHYVIKYNIAAKMYSSFHTQQVGQPKIDCVTQAHTLIMNFQVAKQSNW